MKEHYHSIFIGGNKHLIGGRIMAGFRLRTEGKKHGYNTFVLDTAPSLYSNELIALLDELITEKTLMLGFSTAWLGGHNPDAIHWATDDFFKRLKSKFPNVKFVCGGPAVPMVTAARTIYRNCDWMLMGFSDVAYPKLLDMFSGKTDHGLRYMIDPDHKKKIVESDINHKVLVPDDIENVLEPDDGFLPHQPIPLEVARGCIFRCSFCSHPFQGAKDYDSYQRTPESIARELRRNYELFGTTRYAIMDDTFNDSMEKLDRLHRAIDLAKLPDFKFMSYLKPELLVTKPEMIDKLGALGVVGGFLGIESMNNPTRKAVKKGMDVERVVEAVKIFRQRTNVKLEASFIVGLPHDTVDNQYKTQEFMKQNINDFCVGWHFDALGLYVDKNGKGICDISKNPAQYGYEIVKRKLPQGDPGMWLYWKNEYMAQPTATAISTFLTESSDTIRRSAGWRVPTAWHLGMTDDEIESLTVRQSSVLNKGKVFERERAVEMLARFNVAPTQ